MLYTSELWSNYSILVAAAAVGLSSLIGLLWYRIHHENAVEFEWVSPPEISSLWSGKVLERPSIHAHLHDTTLLKSKSDFADSHHITNYDPATGYWLGTVPSTTIQDVEVAVQEAHQAQKQWRKATFSERRIVLRSLLRWILTNIEPLAALCARDSGKMMVDAAFGEIITTTEKLRWVITNGEKVLMPESRSVSLLTAHKTASVCYEPLGVVAACVSWNYPLHNVLSHIISAIFTGNAIIIKPSEYVAFTSLQISNAITSCLKACGHSPDIVKILTACEADAAEYLTKHDLVRHVTFVGGEVVGKQVAGKVSGRGAPVTLELGGKDPALILESADISTFLHTLLRGSFQSSNQNCIGIERLIVHKSLARQLSQLLTPRIKSLQLGSPLNTLSKRVDIGAMISDANFDRLEKLVNDAVDMGADLVVGGKRWINDEFPNGHYFQPTLLENVTMDMEIANVEVFGPIMLVITFETPKEAISLANRTRYGLGASVFGRDYKQCQMVANQLDCGMVSINDFGSTYMAQSLPFGGVKSSGFGRFGGEEGLRSLCNSKAIIKDRCPGVVQTTMPEKLRYFYNESTARNQSDGIDHPKRAWRFVKGLILLIYSDRWSEAFSSLKDLL